MLRNDLDCITGKQDGKIKKIKSLSQKNFNYHRESQRTVELIQIARAAYLIRSQSTNEILSAHTQFKLYLNYYFVYN